MTFRVGQKVVCVDDKPARRAGSIHFTIFGTRARVLPGMDGLTIGRVYTIREICPSHWDGRPAVRLAEIIRPTTDVPYRLERFRPLVTRKTDISIFTAMLSPSQVTVDAMNISDCGREMVR